MKVLGPDLWNGTQSQLTSFGSQTGTTYPLLLQSSSLSTLYGISYDNYFVVDQSGIIRYISPYSQPLGQRYYLGDIRAAVDALLPTAVGETDDESAGTLAIAPSPARTTARISLRSSSVATTIAIVNADGLRVRALSLAPGAQAAEWNLRDESGRRVPAGIYVVRTKAGELVAARRVIVLP